MKYRIMTQKVYEVKKTRVPLLVNAFTYFEADNTKYARAKLHEHIQTSDIGYDVRNISLEQRCCDGMWQTQAMIHPAWVKAERN